MKTPPKHTSVLFILLLGQLVLAQQLKFKSFTTKEGLSNNSVKDMVSDKYGRLWIATWDGLNVYDGNTIKVYKHEVQDSTSLSGNIISALIKDHHNTIWVLTDNKRIARYLGDDKFQQFHFQQQPQALALTNTGEIAVSIAQKWFSFNEGEFLAIDKERVVITNELEVLKSFLLQNYPQLIINDVLKDNAGNIWYATRRNGLYIIPNTPQNVHNEIIEHYTHDVYSPYSFTSNEIEKIYQDEFGNIWLAHKDGGISMAYTGSEQITTIIPHPVKFPHLPNETIRAITKDNKSNIWLGYYTKGIFYYSEATQCFLPFEIEEANEYPDWNRIRSMYTDSKGTLWVGTYNGLIKITGNDYQLINAEKTPNFPNNRNYAFAEDHSTLWIACWGGLGKLNLTSNAFERFEHQDKLNNYHIRHVIKHKDTLVLATEEQGVLFFTEKQGILKQLTLANGISGNSIYKLYFDKQTGNYWIATLGGVSVYHPQKGVIKNLTEEDGLPSHMVYGLLENNKKIWISTTKGIATVNKENYLVNKLPKDQGWQGEEFSEGAVYQDVKGMLFFGGISGLSYLQPDAYQYKMQKPKLHVTVDGKESFSKHISKSFQDNTFTVSITPVHFSGVTPKIEYRLKGLEDHWSAYQGQKIMYKNLAAGNYTLLTKMGSENGEVNELLQVEIKAPFYKTTVFYFIAIVLVFSIIAMLMIRKQIRSKQIQAQMEAKIKERTAVIETQKLALLEANQAMEERNQQLNAQKEEVLALHHQLKNSDFEVDKFKTFVLNSFKPKLSGLLTHVGELPPSSQKQLINEALIKLVNKISEWDYLDQVSELGEVISSQIHFKTLITKIYEQLQNQSIVCQLTLSFDILTESDLIAVDVLRIKLLFQYLSNELIKYVEANASLTISACLETQEIKLSVSSSSSLLKNQWENITQYSPYYKAAHTLMKDLGGKIVNNESAFQFTIHLPVVNVKEVAKRSGVVQLKHLENKEVKHQASILVFCEEEEMQPVNYLLQGMPEQLVFEHEVKALASAVQQINVKALVIYNARLSSEFVQVITQTGIKHLPSVYIAEQIDLHIEELVLDYGVNSVIYLPIHKNFLQKKISFLISQQPQKASNEVIDFLASATQSKSLINPHQKLVKQALEIIRQEISNPDFNVDKLISTLEISRTKCYRVFKEVLQQSPSDVIINLRLQKAKELLVQGSLNISEISFECGFKDPKYFSRMFKKHYGSSPKSYKMKQNK